MKEHRLFHSLGSVLLLCSVLESMACSEQSSQRHPSRYLIPTGYIGWVRIDFEITDAAPTGIEDGFRAFKLPNSGRLQTASIIEYTSARDEYYYYSADNLQAHPVTGWGGGGMIWGDFNGTQDNASGQRVATYEYFFVGTEDQYKKYGVASKDADGHPNVGPIASSQRSDVTDKPRDRRP